MDPVLYQFKHPWHWLTYGNNASATQAAIAGLALVGIAMYTLLTRSIRNASVAQLRAQSRPILHRELTGLSKDDEAEIRVTNIGAGPAVMIVYEMGTVAKDKILLGRLMAFRPERTDVLEKNVFTASQPGSELTISVKKPELGARLMLLLFYRDISLNRFQTQFLLTYKENDLVGVTGYAEPKIQPDSHPQTDTPRKVKEPVML